MRDCHSASAAQNAPHPDMAAAWFRKVADGGTLVASSVAGTMANRAATAQSEWGEALSGPANIGGRISDRGALLLLVAERGGGDGE